MAVAGVAVGYWVDPEELRYEQGYGQRAQCATLQAVWHIMKEEDSPIYMDSWAVSKGLTIWLPQ
jgi:hypothetical protein